jgi:hypothetical protein
VRGPPKGAVPLMRLSLVMPVSFSAGQNVTLS